MWPRKDTKNAKGETEDDEEQFRECLIAICVGCVDLRRGRRAFRHCFRAFCNGASDWSFGTDGTAVALARPSAGLPIPFRLLDGHRERQGTTGMAGVSGISEIICTVFGGGPWRTGLEILESVVFYFRRCFCALRPSTGSGSLTLSFGRRRASQQFCRDRCEASHCGWSSPLSGFKMSKNGRRLRWNRSDPHHHAKRRGRGPAVGIRSSFTARRSHPFQVRSRWLLVSTLARPPASPVLMGRS